MTHRPADPWVRVVIVTYNPGERLAPCLAALAGQNLDRFEVVIVDNASSDGSSAFPLPDERFSRRAAGANLGFAAGANLGARGATTPWLAILNPDTVPAPDWLEQLEQATRAHPNAAAFGSTQLREQAPDRLDGGGDVYSIFGIAWRGGFDQPASLVTEDQPVFSPCAAAALYRRDRFEAVDGFAEDFFCYLEDVDLGFRLRQQGHSVIQVATARVIHAGSASTGRHSRFTLFHATRNGIFLMVRCLPLPLLLLAIPLFIAAQIALMTRTPHPTARLSGLLAGMAALPRLRRSRRQLRRLNRLSLGATAALLVWNPRHLLRRAIVPLASAE